MAVNSKGQFRKKVADLVQELPGVPVLIGEWLQSIRISRATKENYQVKDLYYILAKTSRRESRQPADVAGWP